MAKKIVFEKWTVYVKRVDGISYEKMELIEEVELTQSEADELNKDSQQNGIRYYERQK